MKETELSAQSQIRLKINDPQTGHHPITFAPLPGIWFVAFVKIWLTQG